MIASKPKKRNHYNIFDKLWRIRKYFANTGVSSIIIKEKA